jgi:hypothetical protein
MRISNLLIAAAYEYAMQQETKQKIKMVCVCTLLSASKLTNGLNRVWLHAACTPECLYLYL